LKFRDSGIEADEPGLVSFIENGKRAGDPQAPTKGFLPASLFVNEQDIGTHLDRERDGLAFAWIELLKTEAALGIHNFHPCWRTSGPLLDRFRR
jgi:hypothetical protein